MKKRTERELSRHAPLPEHFAGQADEMMKSRDRFEFLGIGRAMKERELEDRLIALKSIANNAEIDVIWDQWQAKLEPLRKQLNEALGMSWQEWEIPRELSADFTDSHRSKDGEKICENLRKSADKLLTDWKP